MDLKFILADTTAAITHRWSGIDDCPHRATIAELAAQIHQLEPLLKQKKIEKQQCAKAFGPAKAQGSDVDALKRQMQEISDQLSSIEQQRKALEEQLLSLFNSTDDGSTALPARFDATAARNNHGAAIRISAITDSDAEQWDAYVCNHPQSAFYHRYAWRGIIQRAFAHHSFYWVARDTDGVVRGILPVVRLQSALFGDFGVSIPFFNYGGVLADSDDIAQQLLSHAATSAKNVGMQHLEVRCTKPTGDWPARTDKVSMILRLPDSEDALEAHVGSKIRAQIKRAQQQAPEVRIGSLDLLDDFYAVFAQNMRDLGTPVYEKQFFRLILEAWPDQAHIIALRLGSKPVAAALLLGDRDMMEIPWASTLQSANAMNMNMLLYREVLGFSIQQAYRFFDFGRSSKDSGTYRFKKQWGAEPLQHYWHYWLDQSGTLPELKPDSPKFRLLIACWKKLPLPVANLIGPHIVKNLP